MSQPCLSEALSTALRKAIYALPAAHCAKLQHGEVVNDQYEGFVILQDWAVVDSTRAVS